MFDDLCHKFLSRWMSKIPRMIENAAIGVAIVAVGLAMTAPDLARDLLWRGPAPVAAVEKEEPWKGPVSRHDVKKYVTMSLTLTQFPPTATRARAISPPIRR